MFLHLEYYAHVVNRISRIKIEAEEKKLSSKKGKGAKKKT